jgi:hypothetical protein
LHGHVSLPEGKWELVSKPEFGGDNIEDWFIANLSEKYLATKTRFVAGQYLYIYIHILFPLLPTKRGVNRLVIKCGHGKSSIFMGVLISFNREIIYKLPDWPRHTTCCHTGDANSRSKGGRTRITTRKYLRKNGIIHT